MERKKAHFHSWLTDHGKSLVTLQIGKVLGAMEIATNLRVFKERVRRQSTPALFSIEEMESLQEKK